MCIFQELTSYNSTHKTGTIVNGAEDFLMENTAGSAIQIVH